MWTRFIILASLCAVALPADPRLDLWIRAQTTLPVAPNVQKVTTDDRFVYVESAGLSLQSLGALEARPFDGANGIRRFTYRIPRYPKRAALSAPIPTGVIGTFINGVPIYRPGSALSYQDQNLWHVDTIGTSPAPPSPLLAALLQENARHSPLIGFALDGYPIYGPFGWDGNKRTRRQHSSYCLRASNSRITLKPGVVLTPAQEGPRVNAQFPPGTFIEDYEYIPGSGDLDEHNGRFAITPEFPQGTYAYFLATKDDGSIAYPYLIGPTYAGDFETPTTTGLHRYGTASHLALFTQSATIQSGQDVVFTLESPYPSLEKVHEKPMHLVMISADLADFQHIHPDELTTQLYRITHRFPHAGSYWLFVDHTPPGQPQTIARFQIQVEGSTHAAAPQTANRIRAQLETLDPLQTGQDIRLRFYLRDSNGDAISDLQPYLGAWGHIMIVSQDAREFIHAHPLENNPAPLNPWEHSHAGAGPSPSEIETTTGFRQPGLYKIWLQIQRDGNVLTFPYTIHVEPSPGTKTATPHEKAIEITVSSQGYQPARIEIPAGRPTRLAFHRLDAQNCARRILFPELGIERALPPGATVIIDVPPQQPGELHFACGMGMYRGTLLIRAIQ